MGWNGERDKTDDALMRIVALLLALASLAERAGSLPQPVRSAALWFLRPAEAVPGSSSPGKPVPKSLALTAATSGPKRCVLLSASAPWRVRSKRSWQRLPVFRPVGRAWPDMFRRASCTSSPASRRSWTRPECFLRL